MQDTFTNSKQIYPLSDFLQNHEAHLAHLRETKTPEVLTIDGRAEVVSLALEGYEALLERIRRMESVAAARRVIAQNKSGHKEPLPPEERDRRAHIIDELTAETERLGLYR